jgi:hypothetical protein
MLLSSYLGCALKNDAACTANVSGSTCSRCFPSARPAPPFPKKIVFASTLCVEIVVSFSFVSAAVLHLPDTGRVERRHQTACLSPFLRVASRCFTFILTRSYVRDVWVRLFPQPFFASLARAGSLSETGRSVNTATNGQKGVNKHCER